MGEALLSRIHYNLRVPITVQLVNCNLQTVILAACDFTSMCDKPKRVAYETAWE